MTELNQPDAGETCSASRHVLTMAADLARDGHCQHIVDEPKHCAESMLATVQALWAARNAARATAADHVGDANKMVPDERQLFESWVVLEAGPGATKRWLNTDAYENMRVNDYRTGWVACLELISAAPQPAGAAWHLDESETSLLHQLTSPDDGGDYSPLTLRVGHVREDDGTVKFGLLCEYTDYPEEGATILVERDPAPQPVGEEPCRIEQPTGWRCTRANGHEGPCAAVEDRA